MNFSKYLFILIILYPLSCKFSADYGANFYSSKIDNEILPEMRKEIEIKNTSIFNSIKSNNPQIMYNMFIDEVKKQQNPASMRNYYSQIIPLISNQTFSKKHEYYVNVTKMSGNKDIILFDNNFNEVNIVLPNTEKNLYLSFYESTGYFNDNLITILYGKDENKNWELMTFFVGAFKIMNNNANDLLKQVNELLEKGYIVPAILRYQVMAKYINPSPALIYKNNENFIKMKDRLSQKTKNIVFPITIDVLPSKPEIYGFDGIFVKHEFVPVVKYYSKYYNSPNNILQNEIDNITKHIDEYFTGIRATSNQILYQIFSEPPIDNNKKYSTKALSSLIRK